MSESTNPKSSYLFDFLIVALPAVACLVVYFSGDDLKRSLTLIPAEPTLLTAYTTNFVHYTPVHLLGNLVVYLFFSLLSLVIYRRLSYGWLFRASFAAIILIVPMASSALLCLALPLPMKVYGFSAVSSAAVGLFGFGIALLAFDYERDIMLSYLYIVLATAGVLAITYKLPLVGIALFLLGLVPLVLTALSHRSNPEIVEKYLRMGLLLSVYLIGGVSIMFPEKLVRGGSIVNILAHWIGLMVGLLIPFLIWQVGRRYRTTRRANHLPANDR